MSTESWEKMHRQPWGKAVMDCKTWTLNAEQREIVRLLQLVAGQSDVDVYFGKRGTTRYRMPMPFEATHDPSNPSAVFPITLHDMSETGIAFLSKHPCSPKANLYIREFSSRRPNEWIGARVTHSTGTLQGAIIGAKFHYPIDESDWAPKQEEPDSVVEPEAKVDSTPRRQGLLARMGF